MNGITVTKLNQSQKWGLAQNSYRFGRKPKSTEECMLPPSLGAKNIGDESDNVKPTRLHILRGGHRARSSVLNCLRERKITFQ